MPSTMRVRVVKSLKTNSALDIITSLTALTADLADAAQFTPLRAAASILLTILQTVQSVEINKTQCFRLAHRATKILLDLQRHMEGKWDSAPRALISNVKDFEKHLTEISEYMSLLVRSRWVNRIMQKSSIETDLADYAAMLDDAERSFHIASLIEIHHIVNLIQMQNSSNIVITERANSFIDVNERSISPVDSLPQYESTVIQQTLSETYYENIDSKPPESFISNDEDSSDSEFDTSGLNGGGFKRYHQSDVQLKKKLRHDRGFWSNTSMANVGGQKALVKRYEVTGNSPAKQWIKDIKVLKSLYHPNLPQLIGYSDEESTANPFVVMAHIQLQDITNVMWKKFQSESVLSCVTHVLKNYRDIASAALYVQRQLSLDESQLQDFIADASYALDSDNSVIVGLPPPRTKKSFTARSYRLTGSLIDQTLSVLPNAEKLNLERALNAAKPTSKNSKHRKFAHMMMLLDTLLPERGDRAGVIYNDRGLEPKLSSDIEDLVDEDDLSLADLRSIAINAGRHIYTWHEAVSKCKVKFEPGDIGFLSGEETGFDGFVKIANILDHYKSNQAGTKKEPIKYDLTMVKDTLGTQSQWVNGFHDSQEAWPFLLPNELEAWVVAMNPGDEVTLYIEHRAQLASVRDAWKYLFHEGSEVAKRSGIEPQDLILITRATRANNHTIRHLGHSPLQHHGRQLMNVHGAHNRNLGTSSRFDRLPPPTLTYLFTSNSPNFEPYWSMRPMLVALGSAPPRLPVDIHHNSGWPEAYINYIQLTDEDFLNPFS